MILRLWKSAADLAAKTPSNRNRCVDFLRAASILAVVFGHWLMAAPWVDAAGSHLEHMLAVSPWTQWLTWGLQVMPVFFFVGGYSNGVSWDAATRDGRSYQEWLGGRLRRLLSPVLILLTFWAILAVVAHLFGVPAPMIRIASQVALVPTWFLAVYTLVILLVPLTRKAWKTAGMGSFWIPAGLACAVDAACLHFKCSSPGWINYLFIWIAVHQLGYAWLEGRFRSTRAAALWCLLGLATLVLLTETGPWPRSLVGVPGDAISNTQPPRIPLLALAAFQFGAVLLLERPLARWLERSHAWTATVLINGLIMTIYLWHSTVMMLLIGLAILLGGIGLNPLPGSEGWWFLRAPWILAFFAGLVPFALALSIFERPGRDARPAPAAWRMALGSLVITTGLALLAKDGIGAPCWEGLRIIPLLLPFAGMELAGFGAVDKLISRT